MLLEFIDSFRFALILLGDRLCTVKSYARHPGMSMVDLTAVQKIVCAFEVTIEELMDVVEE
ncbi:hypothetical protein [Calothrix sp. PCC 7507]|uniref:hypothetical protein n=1 Tax=Calothrix sp. PCC 7507 TaxID=99598 RepID=UPI00029F3E87|nr:hypothetical protein [Calothrix sp. PCC 7507]AFY36314.1 hypothetical protein Cal7507_6005 [Calothrix sp. PCC 7507]